MSELSSFLPEFEPEKLSMAAPLRSLEDAPGDREFRQRSAALRKELKRAHQFLRSARAGNKDRIRQVFDMSSAEEADKVISETLAREQKVAELQQRVLDNISKLGTKTKGSRAQSAVRKIRSDMEGLFIDLLTHLRDVRWEIMALQAEREPRADGSSISTPKQVDEFFGRLRSSD